MNIEYHTGDVVICGHNNYFVFQILAINSPKVYPVPGTLIEYGLSNAGVLMAMQVKEDKIFDIYELSLVDRHKVMVHQSRRRTGNTFVRNALRHYFKQKIV
jgi:hypothetical protein